MKAEELQIGDWVLYTEFGRNKRCKVEIIEPNRVWLNGCSTYVPIEFIEPIQLKPEILELNGFEKVEDGGFSLYQKDKNGFAMYHIYYYHHYYLDIDGYIRGIGTFESVNIQYLHQLQHAMRLCGITKEIEL